MKDAWLAAAEPARRQILQLLAQAGELTAGDIAEHFTSTRSATSQHLAVLLSAGLVQVRPDGRRRHYRLNGEGLTRLRTEIESFWTSELSDLAADASRVHEGRTPKGKVS
ncbi:ArsR/SmtB family transcription factor [Propionibacteriaceae bacterium Y1700]|uniref:ArsR/SmtB family transcription factor n=1 Tax=Microlunatus sp. Y1700 TaxID=3418487 RepID=UPI003DA7A443